MSGERPMLVLIACEESGVVRDAFIRGGHDAMSCDLMPSRSPGPHYQGDVFDVVDYPWDLAICHPECTHLSVSGAKHFAIKRMDGRQQAAVAFVMRLWRALGHVPQVAFENPVSVLSTRWRKPDQIIQPWMFGHFETKATCLWLRGLQRLMPLYRSTDECRAALGLPDGARPAARIHKMAPSDTRKRDRSETYAGVADAFATQWGRSEQLRLSA